MIAQYTAAALVAENKVLCHPASVDSIPSSGDQEDHVSLGMTSALKFEDVLRNAQTVLGIEALCAAQAIDLLAPLQPGVGTKQGYDVVRGFTPTARPRPIPRARDRGGGARREGRQVRRHRARRRERLMAGRRAAAAGGTPVTCDLLVRGIGELVTMTSRADLGVIARRRCRRARRPHRVGRPGGRARRPP